MNAIGIIAPYKYEGMWVFDDPAVGLSREPFVAGIDTMIDRLVASIPNAEKGFRLIFSPTLFRATPRNWNGDAKSTGETGISHPSSRSKAGCVPPCSSILTKLRRNCMPGRSHAKTVASLLACAGDLTGG